MFTDYNYSSYQQFYRKQEQHQYQEQRQKAPIAPSLSSSTLQSYTTTTSTNNINNNNFNDDSNNYYYQQQQYNSTYVASQLDIDQSTCDTTNDTTSPGSATNPVTVLVHKTINSVLQNSRKIIFRVCEATNVKRKFKMFNMYSAMNRRNQEAEKQEQEYTGHDRFYQERTSRGRSISSEHDISSPEREHTERSPLVSAKLDSLAKFIFSRSLAQQQQQQQQLNNGAGCSTSAAGHSSSKESSPTRSNIKYHYTALDSGGTSSDRNPRERAARERGESACREWILNTGGRYDIITHLDNIGSRHNKNWFLLNDSTTRTDRLMTLITIPPDSIALEELPSSECPKGALMELLGSLQHPYIYPILDLGFLNTDTHHYACLVMPFNPRGSLKDLIYKTLWSEPYNKKYTKKPGCLPLGQVQRLGRQILEALLFLRERGISTHGHLHSGNVIIQNGVARLTGVENNLLGLSSRVNAILWSSNCTSELENIDIICFGNILYEMCTGTELKGKPPEGHLYLDLERYPQVAEIMSMIFYSVDGRYPKLEEVVMCDIFRNIDLREMRGTCIPSFKYGLSTSTMSLLNAVKKRQSASLGGSYSEGSSPCTPPSTPRKLGNPNGEVSSSDFEHILDEIVVTSTSLDNFKQYDPLYSPLHICDKNYGNVQSDDNSSTIIRVNSMEAEELVSGSAASTVNVQCSVQQTLAPSTAYKNSKSRRMEYSMRGLKLGVSNPSQDSAFGSMTDGELSRASSFKLSSFQSVSSPIDEGVEDITDHLDPDSCFKYIDSCSSSPCRDKSPCAYSCSSRDPSPIQGPASPIGASSGPTIKSSNSVLLEPPKLVINDSSSSKKATIYTLSPIRKCATTEVFSQKYRVSSFEDMSYQTIRYQSKLGPNSSKSNNFRSFDEQQRKPKISPSPSSSQICTKQQKQPLNRVIKSNSSSINYSTSSVTSSPSTSVLSRLINGKEKNILWKNSILSRKNNLIKSTESFFESSFDSKQHPESEHLLNTSREDSGDETIASPRHKINQNNVNINRKPPSPIKDIRQSSLTPDLLPPLTFSSSSSSTTAPRKSRSESRHLFCLAKLKQNPILDSVALEYYMSDNDNKKSSSSKLEESSEHENSSISESSCNTSEGQDSGSISQTDIRKFIDVDAGEIEEERTPLLEGMEMSPIISPTSSEG
uniref:CSON006281 protein n=1 Tax=Culicoides sonorensis TaxID=179676 RepID=A0A336KBP1_CULSO